MLLSLVLLVLVHKATCSSVRPVIGIVTTPMQGSECITFTSNSPLDHQGSCFHGIYADWISQGGARVVPIQYDLPIDQIDQMLGQVNAVLFTGGELHLQFNLSYVLVAQHIVRHAIQSKDHFPLWFTCMGFQMISAIIAEDIAVIKLNQFDSEGLALNLEITEEGRLNSRMLRGASEEMINVMINQPVTSNLHHDGVLPESFENNQNLKEFFRVISLNKDRKGTPFVSTIEGRNVPLYGVQWHPERPQFDWTTDFSANQRIPHESITVPLMQYFANFFVSEARRNDRKFSSFEAEQNALLFNYPAKFLGDSTLVYMFPPFSRDQ